ncbi:MAG TPA: hypothetical protein ENN61_03295 [Bacteroidaceae bacterium]|nr:hypothetical protein [Bacteroidaceae bacterium]
MSEDFSEFSADVYYSITVDKEGKPKTVLSLSNIECTLVGNPIVSSLGIDLPRYPERFLFYENTVFDVNGEEVSIGLTKIKFLTKKSADCFSGCVSETNGLVHYALIADTDINSKMLETLAIMDKLTPATDFRIDERSLDSIRKTANEVKNGGVAITEFYGKALLTGGKITFGITKYMTAGMAALIKQRKEVLKAFDSAEKAINDMAETVREEVARRSLPSEVKEFYKDIPSLNDMAGKIDLWKRMEKLVNKSMYISDEFDIMLRDTDGNEYKATISWKMNSKNELDVEILDRKNILLSNKASPDYGKPVVAGSDVSSDVLMISIDYSNSLNGISGTGPYVLRVTYKVNSEGIRIDADQKDFRLYDSSGNELAGKARIPNSDGGAVKNVNELSIIFDGVDLTDGQQVTIRGKVADSKNSASIKNIDDTVRINLQTKKPEKI